MTTASIARSISAAAGPTAIRFRDVAFCGFAIEFFFAPERAVERGVANAHFRDEFGK
jgi:hypothetical protein